MQITRNNAEAFFLDYYEGNLSEERVAELFAFLKMNPDLREAFEAFGDVSVNEDSISSPDFSFLKKEAAADEHESAEQWMVDFVEGTISDDDRASLEKYLEANPAKRRDIDLLRKTIFEADAAEVFGDVSSLKKNAEITAENFSDFAIAEVEGTISSSDKKKLDAFIAVHPQYAVELENFHATKLQADDVRLEDKSFLKRTALVVSEDNIMELLVAKMEGELSAGDNAAVEEFITRFPEYKIELAQLERTKLQPDAAVTFEGKENLRKGQLLINESNFEQYAISSAEGLLKGEQLVAFNAFVAAHPKYKKVVAAYASVRLQPDMTVVYEDKASLKRKDRGGYFWWTANVRFAAAAIVVIVFGIYMFVKFGGNGVTPGENPIANIDSVNNSKDNNIIVPDMKENDGIASVNTDINSNGIFPVDYNENRIGDTAEVPQNKSSIVAGEPIAVTPADFSPGKANDAVNYSDALYAALDNPQHVQNAEPAKDNRYISAGQFAMRWVKNKIDAGNPQYGNNYEQPETPGDVDGLDITESAINRVGQSAANGNISMNQREDGTYLHLWKYSVRVSSKGK